MTDEQAAYIIEKIVKEKEDERVIMKLDIAECINFAYIGSQATEKGRENKGLAEYKKWQASLRKHFGGEEKQQPNFWDKLNAMRKGKKKVKF